MPAPERFSKCVCENCGGRIEYPSEGEGQIIPCPHCQWPTRLGGEAAERSKARKETGILLLTVIAIAAVAVGGAVYYRQVYLPQHPAAPAPPPPIAVNSSPSSATNHPNSPKSPVHAPPRDPWHGLMAGPITLEKAQEGGLVYAVGTISNSTDHQRFGVKVELDVFNSKKKKIGVATDYTQSIDPAKVWKFRAMVTDRDAASARVASVKED